MQHTELTTTGDFRETGPNKTLIHDSPYVKIIQFSLQPRQTLPLHKHEDEGFVSLTVIEGEGFFLHEGGKIPAKTGDNALCPIAEPHGVEATTAMRVLAHIAPPV